MSTIKHDPAACAELVRQARELTDGTTDGPWFTKQAVVTNDFVILFDGSSKPHVIGEFYEQTAEASFQPSKENAEFACASRTLVPALADALEAALREIEAKDNHVRTLEEQIMLLGECCFVDNPDEIHKLSEEKCHTMIRLFNTIWRNKIPEHLRKEVNNEHD